MKKRLIQTISMLILGVMLSCALCFNTAKADDINLSDLISQCIADVYGDSVGVNAGTLQDGVSRQRQGWLVYIIDQYGSIIYEPAFLYRTSLISY